MKKIKTLSFIVSGAIGFVTSCTPSVSTPATNSVQYPFAGAINQITATVPGAAVDNTIDLKTHSYSFTPTVNGTITQLGYLFNNSSLTVANFRLSLWDATPGSAPLATTGQQTFVNTNPNFVYFPIQPVVVTAGQTYYVSREFIPVSTTTNVADYIGSVQRASSAILPQTLNTLPSPGNITINQSYFTDNSDPRTATPNPYLDFNFLPYIDFQIQ